MASGDPIRVFVTHAWRDSDDYNRVFEYLESARNFFYRNYATPDHAPVGDKEKLKEDLRKQIGPVEAVIAVAAMLKQDQALLHFQMVYGQSLHRPVLLLPVFGQVLNMPAAFQGLADESLQWDERALVDALRRQARHEETHRWDTIEFKLD